MTESLDKSRENKKKFPLTAGTAIFMSACFLLVMGLCKFSFYVLKNHRSAVSRDEFIQTYVDVQPFAAETERKTASYIILKDSDTSAPAAFFTKKPEKEITVARAGLPGEAAPLPVYKRPPVIRPAVQPVAAPVPSSVSESVEEDSIPDADSLPVSLDALMAEGRDVLDSSDKLFLDSQDLLAEEETVVAQAAPVPVPVAEPAPLPAEPEKPAAALKPQPKAEIKPAAPAKTAERWIDIAALREQLKKEQANASFMDNGAGKVAAAAVHETDSVEEAKTATIPAETKASVPEKAVAAADKKSEPAVGKTVAEAPASPFLTKEQIAEQNIFPKSPWKVAKVGGKSANALAVKNGTGPNKSVEKNANAEQQTADAAVPLQESAKVIYKNGRAKKIDMPAESDKPLNWLDRKEAAVWTSLSQSDSPSVWTVGDSRPAETAKAFRVAVEDKPAEQQGSAAAEEKTEISSAPVRTVGKEEKPEAIANPVLLPLGSTVGTPVPAAVNPAPVAQAAAAPTAPAVPAAAPVIPAPTQTAAATAPVAENKEDPSLVNKLFSIFNSSGDENMPTIGGAVPLPEDKKETAATPAADSAPDKKEVKTVVLKTDAAPTSSAEKKTEQEILPTEIRLTFKPDGAEISAQSVKWIKAFGLRVKKDIQRAVEVRMSNENIPLQEKRFALIRSTLVGVGVDDAQIVPFMTNRSPHTIILRVFDVPEEGVTEYTTSLDGTKETVYYRKW